MTALIIDAQSFEERLETLYSYFDRLPHYQKRHVEYEWNPHNNICAILVEREGSHLLKSFIPGANIVTEHGDQYYAKKAAGIAPATNEGASRIQMANPAVQVTPAKTHTFGDMTTPITASNKLFDQGFPTADDDNAENPGKSVDAVTYRVTWGSAEWNAEGIKNGCVHDHSSPVSATKVITLFAVDSFNKTSNQLLKVYVNHSFAGV